jgi:hypothetical protein
MAIELGLRDAFDDGRQRRTESRPAGSRASCRIRVAGRLASSGERRRDDGLAGVFTSDLGRAIETAEIAFRGSELPCTTTGGFASATTAS